MQCLAYDCASPSLEYVSPSYFRVCVTLNHEFVKSLVYRNDHCGRNISGYSDRCPGRPPPLMFIYAYLLVPTSISPKTVVGTGGDATHASPGLTPFQNLVRGHGHVSSSLVSNSLRRRANYCQLMAVMLFLTCQDIPGTVLDWKVFFQGQIRSTNWRSRRH